MTGLLRTLVGYPLVAWFSLAFSASAWGEGRVSGPWNLKELRQPPAYKASEPIERLLTVYYENEPFRGKSTQVFAYLALPKPARGPMPAMVLVHGGGGTAFKEWTALWAGRGYVALAMDLAGCGPERQRLANGGPGQDEAAKFGPDEIKDCWTYHAVAAVIRGVSLLAARPEVDPQRIGITGISWGGYLTCIVAGLDDRLKVAVPVYGCGFIHENSAWLPTFQKLDEAKRKRWIENYEPSKYLGQARMPMLFVNGTNDFAYPLDSYQKSYRLVKDRNLCITVNMPHGHSQGWAPREIGSFVDSVLNLAPAPARFTAVKQDGSWVEARFRSEAPVAKAALHWSTDTGPWKERKWKSEDADVSSGKITAALPAERPLVYFLTLSDRNNVTVSSEHCVLEK